MREATQFVRCDGNELVNLDHVISMRVEGTRATLTLSSGTLASAPFPLPLMVLPASVAPVQSSNAIPVTETRLQKMARPGNL